MPNLNSSQILDKQVGSHSALAPLPAHQLNRANDVAALIEQSKNLLYDLKLIEERNDS